MHHAPPWHHPDSGRNSITSWRVWALTAHLAAWTTYTSYLLCLPVIVTWLQSRLPTILPSFFAVVNGMLERLGYSKDQAFVCLGKDRLLPRNHNMAGQTRLIPSIRISSWWGYAQTMCYSLSWKPSRVSIPYKGMHKLGVIAISWNLNL